MLRVKKRKFCGIMDMSLGCDLYGFCDIFIWDCFVSFAMTVGNRRTRPYRTPSHGGTMATHRHFVAREKQGQKPHGGKTPNKSTATRISFDFAPKEYAKGKINGEIALLKSKISKKFVHSLSFL